MMIVDFNTLREKVENALKQEKFDKPPENLYAPVSYTLSTGGKRIRPVLSLMAYNLFKDDYHKVVYPALGLEIFHNFTLIHDDIMDNSQIRRGRKTVFSKWNSNIALLSGDAMSIVAGSYINKAPANNKKVLDAFFDAAIKVCEGQQYDMDYEKKSRLKENEYLNMISLKTGALIAVSLKLGALMAETSDYNASLLYDFGMQLGLAFQLQDDWLDCYAEEHELGKTIGEDIINNKKTYLWIKARELANTDQEKVLNELEYDSFLNDREKINKVIQIYNELNVSYYVEKKLEELFSSAEKYLNSIETENLRKSELRQFMNYLRNRNA